MANRESLEEIRIKHGQMAADECEKLGDGQIAQVPSQTGSNLMVKCVNKGSTYDVSGEKEEPVQTAAAKDDDLSR